MKKNCDNTKLLDFHKNCKKEFEILLKDFNILLYGYGCKRNILEDMFPNTLIHNFKFSTVKDLVEDLILEGYYNKNSATLRNIDNYLVKQKKQLMLILLNFDLRSLEFRDLKAIKFIATIENINFNFTRKDIKMLNFVLCDFTTFQDYSEEIIDMDLLSNKIDSIVSICNNLGRNNVFVFLELLKLGGCTVSELFNVVKKPLMMIKSNIISTMLHEFIDHKIIKIFENNIEINLKNEEQRELIKILSNV